MADTIILDCYTDEPSGYGVRPFLGTHQIHLSQALSYLRIDHIYLTIDDLRYSYRGSLGDPLNTDLRTFNCTRNRNDANSLLNNAKTIYIIMGCFVDYKYFSTIPPKSAEVYFYLKSTKAKKFLFYVLGTKDGISPDYKNSFLSKIVDRTEYGNTYRVLLENSSARSNSSFLAPNYTLLDKISSSKPQIISQICFPVIAEIETGTGCNTPSCSFCIESIRALAPKYREPESIIKQVKCLYDSGIRHFRLGRQPNFYDYHSQDLLKIEKLLNGIRELCPSLETLHIDNANALSVISPNGVEITKMLTNYCTSGNIAPIGVESFDMKVRKAIRKIGTPAQILRAIEIINEHGQIRGPDGFPILLPGINLIYGLPKQSKDTHRLNLENLNKILEMKLHARRLFFRKLSSPTGVNFSPHLVSSEEYDEWFQQYVELFVIPMQKIVFPVGTILKNFKEIIWKNGDSYLRVLGTCSIRVIVKSKKLEPYIARNIRVRKSLGYRLLEGEVLE